MYKIILSKQTAKALSRMTPGTRERIFRMLEKLQTQPLQGKKLHGELEALLSLRAGGSGASYMRLTPRSTSSSSMALVLEATSTRNRIPHVTTRPFPGRAAWSTQCRDRPEGLSLQVVFPYRSSARKLIQTSKTKNQKYDQKCK